YETVTYAWTLELDGDVVATGDSERFDVSYSESGDYVVKVVVTADDTECEHSANVSVEVPDIECEITGPLALLPNTEQEYTGIVNNLLEREPELSWLLDGTPVGSDFSFSQTWEEGDYTLSFKAAVDGAECEASIDIKVSGDLTCELDGQFEVIPGEAVTYSLLVDGLLDREPTYEWYVDGEQVDADGTSYSVAWEPGTHTIRAVVTTEDGAICEATGDQTIEANYSDVACNINVDGSIAPGERGIDANVGNLEGRDVLEYRWYVNGELVPGQTGPTLVYDWQPGTYDVRYEVVTDDEESHCGNSGSITITVEWPDLVCRSPRGSSQPYVGQTITYEPNIRGDADRELTYSWTLTDTTTGEVVASGTSETLPYTFDVPEGTYRLEYTVTATTEDGSGDDECSRGKNITVREAEFTCRDLRAIGDNRSGQFIGTPLYPQNAYTYEARARNPQNLPLTFTWSTGQTGTGTRSHSINHSWGSDGIYTLNVTISSAEGIGHSCDMSILIRSGRLNVNFQLDQSTVQIGDEVCVDNTTTYNGDTAPTYTWTYPAGAEPANVATDVEEPGCFTFSEAGSYTFELFGELNGLEGQRSRRVTVVARQEISAQANPEVAIVNQPITFTATGTQLFEDSYLWYLPGLANPVRGQSVQYAFSEAGTYTVRVTGEGELGVIEATVEVTVSESAEIRAAFDPNTWSALAPAEICFTDGSEQADQINSWQWDFGNGITSNEQNPCVTYTEAGEWPVTLEVTNIFDMTARATNIVRTYDVAASTGSITISIEPGGRVCFGAQLEGDYTIGNWNFGDGVTSSETAPCHTYEEDGDYLVALTYTDGELEYEIVRQITVRIFTTEELPNLKIEALCVVVEEGAAPQASFTITNTGGDMTNPDVANLSNGESFEFQLVADESVTFETDGNQSLTLTLRDSQKTVSLEPCFEASEITISSTCNLEDGSGIFTITNLGGDMSVSGDVVMYTITNAAGDVVQMDDALVLAENQTFEYSVPQVVDPLTMTVSLNEEPVGTTTAQECWSETPTPETPTDTPTPEDTPTGTPVSEVPPCGETTTGPDGFPVIDMDPTYCEDTPLARDTWNPITIGEAVCPDWLVYHTNQTGDWEIFRLGGDERFGDDNPNLSQGEGERIHDFAPSRSPDGAWITFASIRDGNWEIYVAPVDNVDSDNQIQRVTYNTLAIDVDPVWSPGASYDGGSLIVYESARDGQWELYMLDVRTGVETRLTDHPANDLNPFWSPDGTKLVYQSDRDGFWQIYELDLTNLDENDIPVSTLISDGIGDDHDPMYSHDGEQVLFRSYRDGDNSVIYVMDADGENVERISDPAGDATNHAWAPDDSLVAYQSDLDGDLDIYVYEFASEEDRKVTDNDVADYAPTWRCGSTTVVFSSDVDSTEENVDPNIFETPATPITDDPIVVEDEAVRLTTSEEIDYYPQNSPAEENASRQGSLPTPPKNK
ncbi:MAG: PKD domain-containing protein, partial [Chloroflexi bacterium]|nr:PKD domain-containing protein [Chloroflexota bacterium]